MLHLSRDIQIPAVNLHPLSRRSVILTGARRVGKATILYQMIEALLSKGVDPTGFAIQIFV
jgi:predicted AAA+ superfamily ATPase